MKNWQIFAACGTSYLVGIIVSTLVDKKTVDNLSKKNELLQLDNQLAYWYIKEGRFLDYEEQVKQIEEKKQFIEIVKNEK